MRKKVQKLAVYKVDYNILVRRNWGGGDDAFLKYEQNLKIHCFNSRTNKPKTHRKKHKNIVENRVEAKS